VRTETSRVAGIFRDSAGRITAALLRVLGPARIELAEEALQDAVVRALETWPRTGIPDNPSGWLYRVARNRALDLLRHDDVAREKLPLLLQPDVDEPTRDDELALIFLCCHPDLPEGSQIALTLKIACGLGVEEIAAALLTKPATVAQRLVRAKRAFRELRLPAEPSVDSVLSVLYLMFTTGYDAVDGESAIRAELCTEAIRLARLLIADRRTDLPRVRALLALMLLHGSRLPARTDGTLLSDQDRALWNTAMATEGLAVFTSACTGPSRSTYHVEAAIAVYHASAPDVASTDWAGVIAGYDELLAIKPSPAAAVNRAIAIGMAHGPDAGITELTRLRTEPALADYHLLPAALGAMWLRTGNPARAAEHYRDALTMRCSGPARVFLERQLGACLVQ
jgi:RNA polymerase sigma-70 factor, ECF subfamily